MLLHDTLRRFDWPLFASVVVLLTFGTLAIASVALASDEPAWSRLIQHLVIVVAGLIMVLFGAHIDYRTLRGWSRLLYVAGGAILVLVLLGGVTLRGTRGWFVIGGFTLQSVEIAKITFLVFLARYFEQWARDIDRASQVLISGAGACLYVVLILLQPDVGSALLFVAVWFGMLLLVGIRWRHFFLLAGSAIALAAIAWIFLFADYQRARVLTFFQPEKDPLGRGYNITQATIAIGSGQITGRGFGFGSQSQLRFLPEADTDFIFAVIAEEWGLLGAALFLAAWFFFFVRIVRAIPRAPDDFALFFLMGAALLFFVEVSVTVGMNLGMVPVTGTTLPFVSYGGSSLFAHFVILAVVESIRARSRMTV